MRPIKFRAWEPFYKKMLPVYAVNPMNQTVYVSPEHLYGKPGDDVLLKYDETYEGMDSHVYLMQFTGLLDKNGKEVFEGDVVNATTSGFGDNEYAAVEQAKVYWNDEDASFMVWGWARTLGAMIELEVIGNIYENKELVK